MLVSPPRRKALVVLSRKMADLAATIEKARWKQPDNADYQLGISYVAHAIAADLCSGKEHSHFLLASGTPFQL